jgi:hypothetical protein
LGLRTRGFGSKPSKTSWLLIKHRDKFASRRDIAIEQPYSAKTRRLLADIARAGGGNVEVAATGDPPAKKKSRAAAAGPHAPLRGKKRAALRK